MEIVIHSVELRPDDGIVIISYSQKRFIHEWGAKVETWQFSVDAIPTLEIQQFIESGDAIVSMVETKSRLEQQSEQSE